MSRPSFLAGLIGSGIGASRTQPMHEREGDEQGLRRTYQNINLDRLGLGADALPDLLLAAACMDLPDAMAADRLVHYTPTGMAAHPGLPLPAALLRQELWVADIVYFPLETKLLRTARALGCRTLDGGSLAVFQAVEAFCLITGVTPDPERILRHFAELERAAYA